MNSIYLSVLSSFSQERHKISLILENCIVQNWVYLIFVIEFSTQWTYKPLAIFWLDEIQSKEVPNTFVCMFFVYDYDHTGVYISLNGA